MPNFDAAFREWKSLRSSQDEDDLDHVDTLETAMLASDIRSYRRVVDVLRVLIHQDGLERSDGLDVQALRNIRRFIRKDVRRALGTRRDDGLDWRGAPPTAT